MIMEKVLIWEKRDPFIDLIHTLISIQKEAMERNWNTFKQGSWWRRIEQKPIGPRICSLKVTFSSSLQSLTSIAVAPNRFIFSVCNPLRKRECMEIEWIQDMMSNSGKWKGEIIGSYLSIYQSWIYDTEGYVWGRCWNYCIFNQLIKLTWSFGKQELNTVCYCG